MKLELLVDNPMMVITLERDLELVRMVRSSAPTDLAEVRRVVQRMGDVLLPGARAKLAVLQDMRKGPLVTDAAVEKQLMTLVAPLFEGFRAHALLIQTAVGKLQANRTSQVLALPPGIFSDEAAALDFLRR